MKYLGLWFPELQIFFPPAPCYIPNIGSLNSLKKSDMWKMQLTIAINFISSKDNGEERVMHSKSDYIEIMINDKANEIIKDIFDSLIK